MHTHKHTHTHAHTRTHTHAHTQTHTHMHTHKHTHTCTHTHAHTHAHTQTHTHTHTHTHTQIAACEVCSSGLGAKRRSKPPGQPRDVRSPAKLLKLSTSPLTVHSSIATAKPLLDPGGNKLLLGSTTLTNSPIAVSTSLASIAKWSRAAVTGSGGEAASEQQNNTSVLDIEDTRESLDVSLPALVPTSSHTLAVGISGLSDNSVNTTADNTLLASDNSATFHSMSSGLQQIFTTIDEPTTSEEVTEGTPLSSTTSATRIMSSSHSSVATLQGINASCQPEAQLPAENSIYYLLFKLHAEVNNDIFPSVVSCSMQ